MRVKDQMHKWARMEWLTLHFRCGAHPSVSAANRLDRVLLHTCTTENDSKFRRFPLDYVLLALSLILFALSGYLFWQVKKQKKAIAEVSNTKLDLDTTRDPELVLTLRVLDPIAVAKRESRSARVLANHLPVMVKKMVYQEVMKQLDQELRGRKIEVDMKIEYR